MPSQQPELISPAWGISVPKVPPQGPPHHPILPVPHRCSSSQEEQRPDALVTPNGSCCYQTRCSPRKAHLAVELQIKGCSVPSPGWYCWAWTGLPEGSGRWEYQPWERQAQELFLHPFLTETQAVLCWVSFCLLPETFEPADHFHPQPKGACRAKKNQAGVQTGETPTVAPQSSPNRMGEAGPAHNHSARHQRIHT